MNPDSPFFVIVLCAKNKLLCLNFKLYFSFVDPRQFSAKVQQRKIYFMPFFFSIVDICCYLEFATEQ